MQRQRSVIILLALAVALAALASVGGNIGTDQLPSDLKENALGIFLIATVVEFIATVFLNGLEQVDRSPLRNGFAYLLIAAGAVAAALAGTVSTFVAAGLPDMMRPYVVPNVVPELIVVTALTIIVAVMLYRLSGALRLTPDNRKAFLTKARTRYINRLRDALGDAARIELDLREDMQAVFQPALARQELGQENETPREEQALPSGTSITQVYDEAQEELLILGEPGAGKTTLLVELALNLVERARKSKALKMPVVLSLASWAVKRQPLGEWMAAELAETYQVPHKLAITWMEADALLPLLDGLDEVAQEHRAACAASINRYHLAHPLVPLVASSRSTEYFRLQTRLHLRRAVVAQPLTETQVEDYLTRGGEQLAGLRAAIAKDRELRSAIRTPLMLSVMALTYQGMQAEAIPRSGEIEVWRRTLFEAYVTRMLDRPRGGMDYPREQTLHWLSWLAAQMKARGQTEFYLERMQWNWLGSSDRDGNERIELTSGVHWSWAWSLRTLRELVSTMLLLVVVYELFTIPTLTFFGGLFGAFGIYGLNAGLDGLFHGALYGLGGGAFLGVLLGILMTIVIQSTNLSSNFSPEQVDPRDFAKPGEGIWRSRMNGWRGGLLYGLGYGLILGLTFGVPSGLLALFLLHGGLIGPLLVGLFIGLVAGLLGGFAVVREGWKTFGGNAYAQYQKLQRQLESVGVIPHNYVRFLDYAADHVLLQRVGGGYRFIHALLLDYFAHQYFKLKYSAPK